jgi:RNA polymerase sigma-70 factor (ECF subfamily)
MSTIEKDADGLALSIVRDRDDAADVVQDATVRIWRSLPKLRDAAAFPGWALRRVHNAALSHVHRRRSIGGTVDIEQITIEVPDQAQRVPLRDSLTEVVQRLPVREREAFLLHYGVGLEAADIARVMHISPGTVRVTLLHARRALQQRLGAED